MTTGNAPKIEEVIAEIERNGCKHGAFIVASLEKLAALESQPVPVEPDYEEFIEILRSFGKAYPLDIFGPVTEDEQRLHGSLITRNSAEMGRHCAKYMVKAADVIESLQSALQTCRHNSSVTMDELGEMRDALQRAQENHKAAEQNVSNLMAEVAQTGALLMKAESINRRMVELLKEPSEGIADSVRGVLQMLRNRSGVTYEQIKEHCSMRGDDLSWWPKWADDVLPAYVTEQGAALLLFKAMSAELLKEVEK